MDTENINQLTERATELIKELTERNLSQVDIAKLIGTTPGTLSKLKSEVYFPKQGTYLIGKLEALCKDLASNPEKNFQVLQTETKPKRNYAYYLALLASIVTAFAIGWNLKNFTNTEPEYLQNEISIHEAFKIIFESEMQISPYSKNTNLLCYDYQKKWLLDTQNPYTIHFRQHNEQYYYRSKSVDMYAWCDTGDETGNRLNALELFSNELWLDLENRPKHQIDALKNSNFAQDKGFKKIAEISSIFTDVITFDTLSKKPIQRVGKKIARYFKDNVLKKYEKQVNAIISDYIADLSKTACDTVTVSGDPKNYNEELIMQFDCNFHSSNGENQPYRKRIIRLIE